MPPKGDQISKLSFAVAKKVLRSDEMERLACAFLATDSYHSYDAAKAAREFPGGAKADSFRRSIWVVTKKIKEAGGEVDGSDEVAATEMPAKTKRSKRKAADEHVEISAKKKARGGKKSKTGGDEEVPETSVKAEQVNSEDEDGEMV